MKNLIAALVVCAALATASFDADAAKRFGGGASFGKAAPTFSQRAPAAAPAAPTAQPRANQANQAQPKTAPAPAAAQKPSMMRSILGGVAAALGITALLSMLGLGGAGISSLITGLLLAVVVFFVVRMFLSRRRPQTAGGPAAAAPNPFEQRNAEPEQPMQRQAEPAPQQNWQAAQQPQPGVRSGSLMDQLMGGSSGTASTAANAANDGLVDVTPADFDREGFLKTARDNYIKLQKAWDSGNVIEISDFTSNEIFTAVTHQLRDRKGEVYHTEVKRLENELLGIAQQDGQYYASVRFFGTLVVSGETEDFNETWILEKPVEGSGGWLLCAIRQNEEPQA